MSKSFRFLSAVLAISLLLGAVQLGAVRTAAAPNTVTAISYADTTSDPGYYLIGNNKIEFKISKTNGYISSIYNKSLAKNFKSETAGVWPFGIRVGNSWKAADITVDSPSEISGVNVSYPDSSSVKLAVNYNNLKYNGDGTYSGVSAAVEYTVADNDEYVNFNVTLHNNSPYQIDTMILCAHGLSASNNHVNETLACPAWDSGYLFKNPVGNSKFDTTKYLAYPGPGLNLLNNQDSLQEAWLDLYASDTNGGIGIAYIDKSKYPMEFWMHRNYPNAMNMAPVFFDPTSILSCNNTGHPMPSTALAAGASFTTDDVIIAPHSGDWHTMADIYRTEYQKVMVNSDGSPDYLTWDQISPKVKSADYVASVMSALQNALYTQLTHKKK